MSNYKSYNSYYYNNSSNNKVSRSSHSNSNSNSQYTYSFSNESMRIIKRNLVYVINLDPSIADKDILTKKEYFGQYGKIIKVVVNNNKAYNSSGSNLGPSYSAYIYYSTNQEASLAILSVDSCAINNKVLKAAFGTTKYCSYYLKKANCPVKDCVYMHSAGNKADIISKDSAEFYNDQHKLAIKISEIENPKMKEILYKNRNSYGIFPNPYSIYTKKSVLFLMDSEQYTSGNQKIGESYSQPKDTEKDKDKKRQQTLKGFLNVSNNENTDANSAQTDLNKSDENRDFDKCLENSKSRSPSVKASYEDQEKEYKEEKDDFIKESQDFRAITNGEDSEINANEEDQADLQTKEDHNKPNKRFALFNSVPLSCSRFADNKNGSEVAERTKEEKIIRSYYSRYTLSSCFKSSSKVMLEERYYTLINNEL